MPTFTVRRPGVWTLTIDEVDDDDTILVDGWPLDRDAYGLPTWDGE